ncbi:hypothetical protein FACS189490_00520 [Clostridia bacterium]|nr:hypothetical protein FACS189490_00520 [Clostridia bacterium]
MASASLKKRPSAKIVAKRRIRSFKKFFATSFSKEKLSYMFRILSHPADSFYEIRHREYGSVPLALLVVVLFAVCYTCNRIFASFVVNDVDPITIDGITELSAILLLVLLFSIGNWAVTCLMGGEGRFKDILTVVGYALLPLMAAYIPATFLSLFIAAGEEVFYTFIIGFGIAWTAVLVLMGIMTVHNYTLVKTLITLFLTFLAMFIVIFFALLLADMINQLIGFFAGIYTELIFRT